MKSDSASLAKAREGYERTVRAIISKFSKQKNRYAIAGNIQNLAEQPGFQNLIRLMEWGYDEMYLDPKLSDHQRLMIAVSKRNLRNMVVEMEKAMKEGFLSEDGLRRLINQ